MDFKIVEDRIIKCETTIKGEVLICEYYELKNINIDKATNLDHNSEAEEVICVKKENDEFEEELHIIEDICVKSENCMDNNYGFDENNSQNSALQQHGKKRDKCHICKKSFIHLRKHLLLHTREKNYKCDICEKSFTIRRDLRRHMSLHAVLKCTICDKSFTTKRLLNHHLFLHSRNNKCKICGKSFNKKRTLEKHLLGHDKKNFQCTICGISFFQLLPLNEHLYLHTGEKNNHNLEQCINNNHTDERKEINYEDGIKMEVLDSEFLEQDNADGKQEIKTEVFDCEPLEQDNADEKQDIKYEDGIKIELLDCKLLEQVNANINEDSWS